MRSRPVFKALLLGIVFGLLAIASAKAADVYGSIRGTVTDQSGAVVPGVVVKATNTGTGISKQVTTGGDGTYQLVQLIAPGVYSVSVAANGFKNYQATGIRLDVGQTYLQSVQLEVGALTQEVVVEASAVQVEKTSMELGNNLTSRDVTELPLIGRNWITLEQTMPGVVATADRFASMYGANGSRAQFNDFLVNGTDNNDFPLNTPGYTPSPDSIGEVHMVTNTMNPEYGRSSGSIMSAVTKSGTNSFHGDGFEFFRDTGLNARNFFQPSAQIFHQNLFGATIGGPIWKNHTFFFFSYQGDRDTQPETDGNSTGVTTVFSATQRTGVFPGIAMSTDANGNPIPNPTPSPFAMVGEDGVTHPAGTPYGTLFPTGHIPAADLNPLALKLMNAYVPAPNLGTNEYSFQPTEPALQDQEIGRIDHTFGTKDAIWGYFNRERDPRTDLLPFSGASLPGFGAVSKEHYFNGTLAWTHTFGGNSLNEARLGYNRFNYASNVPQTPVQPSSAGFNITPQVPADAGLPYMQVLGYFDLGFTHNGPQPRIDQTYQANDTFTKIVGAHTFKMGFEMRRMQVYNLFLSNLSGNYTYGQAGPYTTGNAGADFLLGIPDQYAQNSGDIQNMRSQEYGAYFQDQWKMRRNMTLTYGVNWDDETPITNLYHNSKAINCWIPGQTSHVFPTAPVGINYPSDPGCTASGYTNHPWHFGPKLGLAWSPESANWLTGGAGKTSLRGGVGVYFNRVEEELALQTLGAPPWGLESEGIGDVGGSPSFANPWQDISTGQTIPNKFPFSNPAPGSNFNFANLGLMYLLTVDKNFSVPYTYNYNLTLQRELSGNMILSVAYVGSMSRKLDGIYNINFDVNPSGCAANPSCVSGRLFQKYYFPNNERYAGVTANPAGSVIGIGDESTFLNSNYNSLQVTLNKRVTHGLTFLASYTWAHNLDYASSIEDDAFGGLAFDPTNFNSNYGNSGLDARQRFTLSYVWDVPGVKSLEHNFVGRRVVNHWEMAGVTTFQTGFPVQIYESGYRELRCDGLDWAVCPDRPNQVMSFHPLNPRTAQFTTTAGGLQGNYWFNPNSYALEPFGTVGDVGRNPFHGPGINNFNWSLYKNIPIVGESKYVQLRFEFYNLFNHTQFDAIAIQSLASNAVVGDAESPNFGRITSAFAPRLIQLAAKIYF